MRPPLPILPTVNDCPPFAVLPRSEPVVLCSGRCGFTGALAAAELPFTAGLTSAAGSSVACILGRSECLSALLVAVPGPVIAECVVSSPTPPALFWLWPCAARAYRESFFREARDCKGVCCRFWRAPFLGVLWEPSLTAAAAIPGEGETRRGAVWVVAASRAERNRF